MTAVESTAPPASTMRERERLDRTLGRRITAPDIFLALALGLWSWSVTRIHSGHLNHLGLVGALPITFFAAIGLAVVSATWCLNSARYSPKRLGIHVAALAVMLYGVAPIVYSVPRYSWLYKHVGVVQLIATHGHLISSVDIYQDWPGFFAAVAWFDRIAGLSSPLSVAGWAQLLFGLLNCLVVAYATRAFELTWRERWTAILLFVVSNWVAQDYFSPQAEGFVLTIGVMAILLHWCRSGSIPRISKSTLRYLHGLTARLPNRLRPSETTMLEGRTQLARPGAVALIVVTGVFTALVIVHELSPYVIIVQIALLLALGRIRPAWLLPGFLVISVAYLAPHITFLNQQYGLLDSIGKFFSNSQGPSAGLQLSRDQQIVAYCARLLSIVIWVLAFVGIWSRWRAGRSVVTLAVLALSPFLLLGVAAYGGEGVLRVFLFSLPWSACLAACALWRTPSKLKAVRWLAPVAALLICVSLFFPSYFGSDGINAVNPDELGASTYLYTYGLPGGVLLLDSDFPARVGPRYGLLPESWFLGASPVTNPYPLSADAVQAITATANADSARYFVLTDRMLAYARAYGLTTSQSLVPLEQAMAQSRQWHLVYQHGGAVIYETTQPYRPRGSTGYSYGSHFAPGVVVTSSGKRYATIATLADTEALIRQGQVVYYEPSLGVFAPITSLQQLHQLESRHATTTWMRLG